MATHTIIIDDKTVKTKSLLPLLKEMAKNDKNIKVDPIPNRQTPKAIDDAQNGNTFKALSSTDLFEQLEK
ncbi:MAG: hypothetical protein ACWA6U_16040 [Breznakibacter sp.]